MSPHYRRFASVAAEWPSSSPLLRTNFLLTAESSDRSQTTGSDFDASVVAGENFTGGPPLPLPPLIPTVDVWPTSTGGAPPSSRGLEDVLVFVGLESLGTLAIAGNVCLIVVLLKNKYLNRASFILMLSLAIADVLHGIATTAFFYPPILLKFIPIPSIGVRIFNVIDWTAWSITLTHMSAICLDRLIAIMLYGRYNFIVTVRRVRAFSIFCWAAFSLLNVTYILLRFCCLIAPLRNNQYYTFGYGEFESNEEKALNPPNIFTLTYTPLEVATIVVLSISNPITLIQLYRRHKRKLALRMASTMLLEMSMRMGSKAFSTDVRELAARRASRQQQRILLQISVVAVIFYLYMTTYYLVYHVLDKQLGGNKWVVMFNSFFYSTTHMINPVIYFSLNKEMRAQLNQALSELIGWLLCVGDAGRPGHKSSRHYDGFSSLRRTSYDNKTSTMNRNDFSMTATETSPLVSQHHNTGGHIMSPKPQHLHYSGGNYAACAVITHDYCQGPADLGKHEENENAETKPPNGDAQPRHGSLTLSQLPSVAQGARNSMPTPFDGPTGLLIDSRRCMRGGVGYSQSMRTSAVVYENAGAISYSTTRTPSSSTVRAADDHITTDNLNDSSNALNNFFITNFDVNERENLELELVSTTSVSDFSNPNNLNDFATSELRFAAVSSPRRASSGSFLGVNGRRLQDENSAFMSLACCLEEQARLFFEAEGVAMERATQQRSALLDALIEALRRYRPAIPPRSDSLSSASSNGPLTRLKPPLSDAVNTKNFTGMAPVRSASNRECGNVDADLKALLRAKARLSTEADCLMQAISERNRMQTADYSSFVKPVPPPPTEPEFPSSSNRLSIASSSAASFSALYSRFPSYRSGEELYHHLSPTSSWRQWREHTGANGGDSTFARLSREEILRDSLLMLLDSGGPSERDGTQMAQNFENDNVTTVYVCGGHEEEEDYHGNDNDEEDDEEVVFL